MESRTNALLESIGREGADERESDSGGSSMASKLFGDNRDSTPALDGVNRRNPQIVLSLL